MAREFEAAGFRLVAPSAAPEVFVLNTCSVTHVADRKARQQLRSARRRFPQALIVATGCYPERAQAEVEAIAVADLVAGNGHKAELVRLVTERMRQRPRPQPSETVMAMGTAPRLTRAFVKIQEGCNDHCSYCIIPKTRGASHFFEAPAVVAAVREREAEGYREVVLTGTQLGDYGIPSPGDRREGPDHRDQATEGEPLAALLSAVLAATTIPRIRVSSLQPQDLTPRLLALWDDARLCPHFHLPLQSGAAPVLARMRRRYTPEGYLAAVERVRDHVPRAAITTDVIAGFPGETAADFEATIALCHTARFAAVHAFPYSERPGTLATRYSQVLEPEKRARLGKLLEVAAEAHGAYRAARTGGTATVLWEEERRGIAAPGGRVWTGLSEDYQRVYTAHPDDLHGALGRVTLTAQHADGLWGEVTG